MQKTTAENNRRKGGAENKLNYKTMKTKVQKKQSRGYVIVHDKNDLLEKLGYPSRKQANINHKIATK